ILTTESGFALEERFKFESAVAAANGAGCDDWDEKGRFADCSYNFIFPQGALRYGRRVLPKPKITAELHPQFIVDADPQFRKCALRVFVILARIAEEPNQ